MIDLETLGVGPRSAILSIGYVRFDPYSQDIGYPNVIHVDVESCIQRGMVMKDSTFRWWLSQSDEARDALTKHQGLDLPLALSELAADLTPDDHVWGNGANFDISILETAHELCDMELPWRFYNVRCYRTVKNLFPDVPKRIPRVAHDAGEDALAQALHLQDMLNVFQA